MKDLYERIRELEKATNYANSYVDSVEFLLVGIFLGVLGGIWGGFINDYLSTLLGNAYIGVLAFITILVLYWLSFPLRRARTMVNVNLTEIRQIENEFNKTRNESPRPEDLS